MTGVPFLDRLGDALERAITPEPPRRRSWGPVAAAAGFAVVLGAGALWWLVGAGSREPRPDPVATTTTTTPAATTVTTAAPDEPAGLPTIWGRVPGLESLSPGGFATLTTVITTPGGFVASGTVSTGGDLERAVVLQSHDGAVWAELPVDGLEGSFVNDVALGADGRLVAVGAKLEDAPVPRFWTFDGAAWTAGSVDSGFPAGQADVVVAAGEGYVAAGTVFLDAELAQGQLPVVWVSADGAVWEERPLGSGAPVEAHVGALAARDGRVVAGGVLSGTEGSSAAAVWTSDDLAQWRFVALPTDTDGFAGVSGVATGGPGLVAVGFEQQVGTAGAVWTSEDGTSWRRVPHDDELFGGAGQTHTRIQAVASTPAGLVAVGSELLGPDSRKVIWTSPDGLSWERTDVAGPPVLDGATLAHDVAASGGAVVVVGAELSVGLEVAVPAAWVSPPPAGVEPDAPIAIAPSPPPPEPDEVAVAVEPEQATPGTRVRIDVEGPRGQDSVVWLVGPGGEAMEACTAAARGGRQRWCHFRPDEVGVTAPGRYLVAVGDPGDPAAATDLEVVAPGTVLVGLDGLYTPFLHPLVQQLSIRNHGDEPLDLSGWAVQAPAGTQRFDFPAGTTIGAGQAAIVFQGGPGGAVCPPDAPQIFYTCNQFEGGVGATAYWTGGAVLVDPADEVRAEWTPPR